MVLIVNLLLKNNNQFKMILLCIKYLLHLDALKESNNNNNNLDYIYINNENSFNNCNFSWFTLSYNLLFGFL